MWCHTGNFQGTGNEVARPWSTKWFHFTRRCDQSRTWSVHSEEIWPLEHFVSSDWPRKLLSRPPTPSSSLSRCVWLRVVSVSALFCTRPPALTCPEQRGVLPELRPDAKYNLTEIIVWLNFIFLVLMELNDIEINTQTNSIANYKYKYINILLPSIIYLLAGLFFFSTCHC